MICPGITQPNEIQKISSLESNHFTWFSDCPPEDVW